MKRRNFLVYGAVAIVLPSSVLAQSIEDEVTRQLRDQGYSRITVSRTLLGRTRIVATSDGRRREIILNPRTGEILRDLWQIEGNGAELLDPSEQGGSSGSSGSGSGSSSSNDDDDDNDDDHDDDSGRGRGRGRGGDEEDDDDDRSGRGGGDDDD